MKFEEIIETSQVKIGLREDGIIYLYLKDEFVFDNNAQNWLLIAYKYLCRDRNRPLVMEGGEFIRIKKEVNDYLAEYEDEFPIVSTALVAKNTAQFLLAKFFLNMNKTKIPMRIFRDKKDAFEWAKQFLESPVPL